MRNLLKPLLPTLLCLAYGPSAFAWSVTNATNQCSGTNGQMMNPGETWQNESGGYTYQCGAQSFTILVANGGGFANYNGAIAVGASGACANGANGCGLGSNANQYMTMAQAGAGNGQQCAGSGVPADGSIVYTWSGYVPYLTDSGLMANIYDASGNQIWSGALQSDPQNGHNGNKGYVSTNSSGQLQGTWCGANSYNP